jgi:hypothetical protein
MMFSKKPAALVAAMTLGALAIGGCHDGGHHYEHGHHAYRYERDRCDDVDGRYNGEHYRAYVRHGDWREAGYSDR